MNDFKNFQEIISSLVQFKDWFIWASDQKWFTPLINVVTLPLLTFTAREAFRSSRAAGEANELKLLPLIGIYFHDKKGEEDKFTIKNLGEGVAYNIKIDTWTLIIQDFQQIIECQLSLEGTNILTKGQEKELNFSLTINGKNSGASDVMLHAMRYKEASIQIHFKDARGKKWVTLIQLFKDHIDITKPPYRLNVLSKISIWYGINVERNFKIQFEKLFWHFEKKGLDFQPNYFKRFLNILKKKFIKLS